MCCVVDEVSPVWESEVYELEVWRLVDGEVVVVVDVDGGNRGRNEGVGLGELVLDLHRSVLLGGLLHRVISMI
jgi:hypothetical protein